MRQRRNEAMRWSQFYAAYYFIHKMQFNVSTILGHFVTAETRQSFRSQQRPVQDPHDIRSCHWQRASHRHQHRAWLRGSWDAVVHDAEPAVGCPQGAEGKTAAAGVRQDRSRRPQARIRRLEAASVLTLSRFLGLYSSLLLFVSELLFFYLPFLSTLFNCSDEKYSLAWSHRISWKRQMSSLF